MQARHIKEGWYLEINLTILILSFYRLQVNLYTSQQITNELLSYNVFITWNGIEEQKKEGESLND